MTDAEFLLSVLEDGREHTLTEILQRSFRERGCGLTVHSRAADLRRQGYEIANRAMPGGRRGSVYQLRPLEAAVESTPGALSAPGVSPSTAASSDPDEPSAGCVLSAAPTGGPRASEGSLQLALTVPLTEREREAAA